MTLKELIAEGSTKLTEAGIQDAATDAAYLAEYILNIDRNMRYNHPEYAVDEVMYRRYADALSMRMRHVPLQHITGRQEFMGLPFVVNPSVLVPRFDTEFVVEEALIEVEDGMRILDMCTGSGCILLSLMNYKNDCIGVGVDLSGEALSVARMNADALSSNVTFYEGDLYDALPQEYREKRFDVIVSNPPYIATDVIPTLMPEVRDHDPRMALDGGADGLSFYRRIIAGAKDYLNNHGKVILEIGYDQGDAVSKILSENGFVNICVKNDYSGNPRAALAEYIRKDD